MPEDGAGLRDAHRKCADYFREERGYECSSDCPASPEAPLIARIKKLAPPDSKVERYVAGVISITLPRTETSSGGIVSLLLEKRSWSPGLTTMTFSDWQTGHRWMGVSTCTGYAGRGWLEKMTKDALTALQEAAK